SAGSAAARDVDSVVPPVVRLLGGAQRAAAGADGGGVAHRAVHRHADPARERPHARAHAAPRAEALPARQARLAQVDDPRSRGSYHLSRGLPRRDRRGISRATRLPRGSTVRPARCVRLFAAGRHACQAVRGLRLSGDRPDVSRSEELFDRAQAVLPGGVNSPVRAFRAVGGTPFFVDRARGACLTDVDGKTYLDYVCSWGPLILGHAHPAVLDAIRGAAERGWTYGAPCAAEVELAELVRRRMPTIEMVRFVNSGTEATMAAVRVARAATRRDVILKFEGCYHGHADSFLVKAGSGVATLGLPDSPGVPGALAELTLTVPFNDSAAVQEVFTRRGKDIAAVIVEPYVGNAGFIAPEPGFHEALRALCDRHGALLIFDEVMTGFRVAPGGAQQRLGVRADLTTLGKIIGGGLPVGAYGGRADLMRLVAPEGPVYQAGTLSGNPV